MRLSLDSSLALLFFSTCFSVKCFCFFLDYIIGLCFVKCREQIFFSLLF
ncbi:hypothetical protein CLOM621_07738 [Clostridium sp. M62/1]|nr:hypothetical protein CLOM621_07738 [Clostridium sp. M62/1]